MAIVEEGNLNTAKDFGRSEMKSYGELYHDNGSRMTEDKGIAILQGRGVGGSTVVNWTSSFHLPEDTLEFWQKNFGVGWGKSDLADHYKAMENRLNIETWQVPPNQNNDVIERGTAAVRKICEDST